MKKLLTAVVLTGTLLGVAATPLTANAAPVATDSHASTRVLGSIKGDIKDREELKDAITRGVQQVLLQADKVKKPSQAKIKSGVPWITLTVTGSNWGTFVVLGKTHFVPVLHNSWSDHQGFYSSRTGKYVYNF